MCSSLWVNCLLVVLVLIISCTNSQIDGLCKLLTQHGKTLSSLEFVHCTLSLDIVNAICGSIILNGEQGHGIQHFSINASSFRESGTDSLPSRLVSFLSSGRYIFAIGFL